MKPQPVDNSWSWKHSWNKLQCIVMQEPSDALRKTADSDTVSTYQVSSVQLVTDKYSANPYHSWMSGGCRRCTKSSNC